MFTSAAMFFNSAEEAVEFQCPVQETGLTATIEELMSLLQEGNSNSNSGSPNSGSEGSNGRGVYSLDERKRRRMTSNRESARRSRWRKKRHLEDFTEEANRLKMENRELKNRLGLVAQKCYVTWRENERLESESLALWARLSDLNQVLVAMQTMRSQY
ncbi:basic leucine zipper 4 [Rosa rugosa]|uniref:basic leucine zipper 4 n=1 Tax=Rosa rugosa TaxID=74645 RepID=UPI002B40D7C9|nr:basic leucine zipper 4 [Rosa rugosa]